MTVQTQDSTRLGGAWTAVALAPALWATILLVGAPLLAQQGGGGTAKVKKSAEGPDIYYGYKVRQSIEMGGRMAEISGSRSIWNTMVNQSSGPRILSQSMELRALDPHKAPLFDRLSTAGSGFGGDANTLARLSASKGRIWEFAGSFRRDRNFFDFNQFDNPLDPTPNNYIRAQHSLHAFNTVRRNTEAKLTVMPLSPVSVSFGFSHGTHEGPSYNTFRGLYTTELFQWFRNAQDVYTLGVAARPLARTTVNYEQSWTLTRIDTTDQMASPNLPMWDAATGYYQVSGQATPGVASATLYASPGYSLTSTTVAAGCGTNASATGNGVTVSYSLQPYFTNGMLSALCKAAVVDNFSQPMRVHSTTEQLRFQSNYWKRVGFNGRLAYSSGQNDLNALNWLQQGYTYTAPSYSAAAGWSKAAIGSLTTGAAPDGKFGANHRKRLNADLGTVVELTRKLALSNQFSVETYESDGWMKYLATTYGMPVNGALAPNVLGAPPSLWTVAGLAPGSWPVGAVVTAATTGTTVASGDGGVAAGSSWFSKGRNVSNTTLGSYRLSGAWKFSAGFRFQSRYLNYVSASGLVPTNDMHWNGKTLLVGSSYDRSRKTRLNVNYEHTIWSAGDGAYAPAFTRQEPEQQDVVRARALFKPLPWLDLSFTARFQEDQNSDPMVQLTRRNQNYGGAAVVRASEKLGFDLGYSWDESYSVSNTCYYWAASAPADGYPAPYGVINAGTCRPATSINGDAVGSATLYLFNNLYKAPSSFYQAGFAYAPIRKLKVNGGLRYNELHGTAAILNPIQTPASLQSKTFSPWGGVDYQIAPQWTWHGGWTYNSYGEKGVQNAVANGVYTYRGNGLQSRNMHGNVMTLSVKYAF